MSDKLRLICGLLVTTAPLSGQSQTPKRPSHSAAVVRPLSLADSTPLLQAAAETTRVHIVLRLKAAGVRIVDRSRRPLRPTDLNNFVAAQFAIIGLVGIVDSQFVVVARLASVDGDSLDQVRLAGSPASAAVFGDSLGNLFAPTILGRP